MVGARRERALRSVLVAVCVVPDVIEALARPSHPCPAARGPPEGAKERFPACCRKSLEIYFFGIGIQDPNSPNSRFRIPPLENQP